MQSTVRTHYWALLLVPFIASCSTIESNGLRVLSALNQVERAQKFENCTVGCPVAAGGITIHRQAYSLSNNGSTKFANWVAYKITKQTPASGRPRNWATDPDIPQGDTLVPLDYKGANEALQVDRGHQANLASMGGVLDWRALNYLSNITPQKADLNQGAWARLEDKERALSKDAGIASVEVATGPIYERFIGTLPGTTKEHTIPSAYWKVIFIGSTPENGLYASFVMDQNTPRHASFCDYQVTIAQIETLSGQRLWSDLPDETQAILKSKLGELPKMMGCG